MFPQNVFPETSAVDASGHLTIGGCDTVELAAQFGTPLYIFDEVTLRGRCRSFIEEFKTRYANTTVAYASKAFVNIAMAEIFSEEGMGLDVVSGGELAVAQAVNFPKERVYFHGNNKLEGELEQSVEWGIGRIVVDSFYELSLLDEVAARTRGSQDILLRVSPSIDPHTHVKTTTGVLDSKFGFSIETGDAAEAVRRAIAAPHLDLKGLHFHLGSPIFELEPYRSAVEVVLEFAAGLKEEGLNLQNSAQAAGLPLPTPKTKCLLT